MAPQFRRPALLLSLLACLAWFGLTRPSASRPRPLPGVRLPWLASVTPATRATRPNLLLVVYDARRRDDFSFGRFGNRRGDTPFLAEFKDDAAYFESAVAPGSWTVPVHGSMFTGLGVCELGIDYYNSGVFGTSGTSPLSEILSQAGYHTIAWADHPFFYNRFEPRKSLVRGFQQFSVVNDFSEYVVHTNLGRSDGAVLKRRPFDGLEDLSRAQLDELVERFNQGRLSPAPARDGDLDPETGLYLAKLDDLYRESGYFDRRYGRELAQEVFTDGDVRPYFLFVNLHMCAVAEPDPALYSRWFLRTLMLNAKARGLRLSPADGEAGVRETLLDNFERLGLRHGLDTPGRYMKHVFDNRFYDASFRALWEFLARRGLTDNTVTIVTSDHGMSFGEKGESFYAHGGARPHEYNTRVPLVVRFPKGSGIEDRHGTVHEKVSLTDVFPTLVELGLGPGVFERPAPVRGLSLARRLRERRFERVLVAESALRPDSYDVSPGVLGYSKAIYHGDEKAIVAPELYRPQGGAWPDRLRLDEPGPPSGTRLTKEAGLALLYDLAADPHERTDLAAAHPERVERLRRLVRGGWDCRSPISAAPVTIRDPDSLETLKALGYLN